MIAAISYQQPLVKQLDSRGFIKQTWKWSPFAPSFDEFALGIEFQNAIAAGLCDVNMARYIHRNIRGLVKRCIARLRFDDGDEMARGIENADTIVSGISDIHALFVGENARRFIELSLPIAKAAPSSAKRSIYVIHLHRMRT